MKNKIMLFLSFFFSVLSFSHATTNTLLTKQEESYFSNKNSATIKGKSFSFGNLPVEVPNFYGIYRIGSDLIQKTIKNVQNHNSVNIGVIDSNFDTEIAFIKNKLVKSEPYHERSTNTCKQHGTHVVGTICGLEFGIAYHFPLSLWLAKASAFNTLLDDNENIVKSKGNIYFSNILKFFIDNNVKIVSRSMGPKKTGNMFECENTIEQIIKFTREANGIFINAAGNENHEIMDIPNESLEPKNILVISNTDFLNLKNQSSNFGDSIFIAAPGTDIYSANTIENSVGSILYKYLENDEQINIIKMTGTSMATPHVSGTVAVMLGLNPKLSNDIIREILQKTAVNRLAKKSKIYGYGVLNAYAAVKAAQYLRADLELSSAFNKLSTKSIIFLNKALKTLQHSAELNEKELLKIENWLRKAHLSNPNNIKAKHALFLFQKNFGYSQEADCLAIDLFFKTEDRKFLESLSLETKHLLINELKLICSHEQSYNNLSQIVNDSIKQQEKNNTEIIDQVKQGNFDPIYKDMSSLSKNDIYFVAEEAIVRNNIGAFEFIMKTKTRYDYVHKASNLDFYKLFKRAKKFANLQAQKVLLLMLKKEGDENKYKSFLTEVITNALSKYDSLSIIKELDREDYLVENLLLLPSNVDQYTFEVLEFLLNKNLDQSLINNLFATAIASENKRYIPLFLNLDITISPKILDAVIGEKDQELMRQICERTETSILEDTYKLLFKNEQEQDEMMKILFDSILKRNPHFKLKDKPSIISWYDFLS